MTYLATNPLFHGISPETLSRDFDGIVSHLRMFQLIPVAEAAQNLLVLFFKRMPIDNSGQANGRS